MKKILIVGSLSQKVLFDEEIAGQLSDGFWENTEPSNHWVPWCDADVVVTTDGKVGRNFNVKIDDYYLLELMDILGDRMIKYVLDNTDLTEYTEEDLAADLEVIMHAMLTKI